MPGVGLVTQLSQYVGAPEPALRLLLSVFAGYPLALIHRNALYFKPPNVQHLYFILCGLSIGYFNYGTDILHTVFACLFSHGTLLALGGTSVAVAVVFVFNVAYLLMGYSITSTEHYDICWTMPQCILVLRIIGLAFDLYDGERPVDSLSKENRKVALKKTPSTLEFMAHMFFPSSFLVGPQFPMKRYQDFVAGKLNDSVGDKELPRCVGAATRRLLLGVVYLAVFQVVAQYVNDDFLLSERFNRQNFPYKLFLMGVWGQVTLYKYISCWLLAEGACTLFGITHNGKDTNGATLWNGCENIKLSIFEFTTQFNHYILSFNVNTNHWVAQYIYKRLKFLGNRYVSQLAALFFLALWHGFHSGYYVCFSMEFILIYLEKDFKATVASNERLSDFFARPPVRAVCLVLLRAYTFVFMGWCLIPFALLSFDKYWAVYRSVHYIGFVLFWLWPVLYGPLFRYLVGKRRPKAERTQGEAKTD